MEKFIGKKVRVKSKCDHPHSGETGTVLRKEFVNTLKKDGLIVRGDEFGAEFFVFNTNDLQILE